MRIYSSNISKLVCRWEEAGWYIRAYDGQQFVGDNSRCLDFPIETDQYEENEFDKLSKALEEEFQYCQMIVQE